MSNWYDVVNLDRRFILTGVYNSGTDTTTWTLPGTVVDTTLNTAVLGLDFGSLAGDIVTITSAGGTPSTYTASGSYGEGQAVIGRAYTATIELTRPYVTDRDGNADIDAGVHIICLTASLHNTGEARIRWSYVSRADKSVTYDVDPIVERDNLKAWCNGDAEKMTCYIESYGPKPFTVPAIEWVVTHLPRDN